MEELAKVRLFTPATVMKKWVYVWSHGQEILKEQNKKGCWERKDRLGWTTRTRWHLRVLCRKLCILFHWREGCNLYGEKIEGNKWDLGRTESWQFQYALSSTKQSTRAQRWTQHECTFSLSVSYFSFQLSITVLTLFDGLPL